jgi:hypothetical protein
VWGVRIQQQLQFEGEERQRGGHEALAIDIVDGDVVCGCVWKILGGDLFTLIKVCVVMGNGGPCTESPTTTQEYYSFDPLRFRRVNCHGQLLVAFESLLAVKYEIIQTKCLPPQLCEGSCNS